MNMLQTTTSDGPGGAGGVHRSRSRAVSEEERYLHAPWHGFGPGTPQTLNIVKFLTIFWPHQIIDGKSGKSKSGCCAAKSHSVVRVAAALQRCRSWRVQVAPAPDGRFHVHRAVLMAGGR